MSRPVDDRIQSVRIPQEDVTAELSEAFGVDVVGIVPTDDDAEYELLVGGDGSE